MKSESHSTSFAGALWLAFLLVLTLSGCAIAPIKQPQVATKTPVTVAVARPSREPGLLWSEDSKWNEIYSETQSRFVGDIVTIKLGDGVRSRIANRMETLVPKKEVKVEEKKPGAPAAGEEASRSLASAPSADKMEVEGNHTLRGIIKEVLPRNMYVIAAAETVKVGKHEPSVVLQGSVREKDIDPEDSVSSDALLNLNLQVKMTSGQGTEKKSGTEEKGT